MTDTSTRMPIVIAHRGMSALAPENTIAAFAMCADYGVSTIEFDVDIMGDGTLIVIHDDTLDRTTSGTGGYYDKGYADLRRLDAGAWFSPTYRLEPVPELSSVIELMNAAGIDGNLEIKPCRGGDELRQRLVDSVATIVERSLDSRRQLLISSFDVEMLNMMRERAPQIARALLVNRDDDDADEAGGSGINTLVAGWIEQAKRLDAVAIHPGNAGLEARHVEAMRDAGLRVNVWTVNDVERAAELSSWGVDAVFTDRAHEFPETVRRRRLAL